MSGVAAGAAALGLGWLLLLPLVTISTGELKVRGTFIAENALPRHVPPRLAPDVDVDAPSVRAAIASAAANGSSAAWFADALRRLGAVDVALLPYDCGCAGGVAVPSRVVVGGVVRGRGRGSHGEAVVVATRLPEGVSCGHARGDAAVEAARQALSLVAAVSSAAWLAVDVHVIASSGTCECVCGSDSDGGGRGSRRGWSGAVVEDDLEAWLDAAVGPLHGDVHRPRGVDGHRIRAAVVLDWSAVASRSDAGVVGILPAGVGSRLPDMDLVTLLVHGGAAAAAARAPVSVTRDTGSGLKPAAIGGGGNTPTTYWQRLRGLLAFAAAVVVLPPEPHAPFLRRGCVGARVEPADVLIDVLCSPSLSLPLPLIRQHTLPLTHSLLCLFRPLSPTPSLVHTHTSSHTLTQCFRPVRCV
jgi:hypothetical protein